MKKPLLIALFAALLGMSSQASAGKFTFGQNDSVHFVANTTLAGPDNSRLFLGHLVTTHAFLLPYHVESKGLVFGISGDSKRFIPLPPSQQLAELKRAGFLPHELPEAELSLFDYVTGYLLEIFVLVGAGYLLVQRARSKRKAQVSA